MKKFKFWPRAMGSGESGNSALMISMIVTAGLGTVVYNSAQKLSNTQKQAVELQKRDALDRTNLSSLAIAQSLFQYNITSSTDERIGPKATALEVFNAYTARLPFLYPSTTTNTVSPLRGQTSVPGLWEFSSPNLFVCPPEQTCVDRSKMDKVTFKQRAASNTWDVEVEGSTTDAKQQTKTLVQRAQLDTGNKMVVGCHVQEINGKVFFAPNENVRLRLDVYGRVSESQVHTDAADLATRQVQSNIGDFAFTIGVDQQARTTANKPYFVDFITKRPLFAVDAGASGSNAAVLYEAHVYLKPNIANGAYRSGQPDCKFVYRVSSPASCKLWAGNAQSNVPPGTTVSLGYQFIGPYATNFKPIAYRENEKNYINKNLIPGLFLEGGIWKFRVPTGSDIASADSNYFWPYRVEVPSAIATSLTPAIQALSAQQRLDLMSLVVQHQRKLESLLKSDKRLYGDKNTALTMAQATAIARAFRLSLANPKDFDYRDLAAVKLSEDQIELIKEQSSEVLSKFPETNLATKESLAPLATSTQSLLLASNPLYLGTIIDNNLVNSADKTALDTLVYDTITIEGMVSNSSGGSAQSCYTQIRPIKSRASVCRFFGSQYPNYGKWMRLWITGDGINWGWHDFHFKPTLPNWEVNATAASPSITRECPPNARCFVAGAYYPRTPFIIIANADSASCTPYVENRIQLGCFQKDTLIRMADGSDRPVSQLKEGDQVWNPVRQKAFAIQRITAGPELYPFIAIKTTKHSLRVTKKHPMVTQRGLVTADELRADDRLSTEEGWAAIVSIASESAPTRDHVFNFELVTGSEDPKDHSILAHGIITGDLYLQERLERQTRLGEELARLP